MGSDSDTAGPLLAFDTSAAHCAVALRLGGRTITRVEHMNRGQAERLFPLMEEVLAAQSLRFEDLARIGVGIGPGNFTGIRIAVSAARGLALGLDIPAIGVSCLDALRGGRDDRVAAIPAPRDMAYVQVGRATPISMSAAEVPAAASWFETAEALVTSIAELAAKAPEDGHPPAPLYLRPADAAPSRDVPPRILDDV